jgi:queuine/archaeosine tRNA-ribosyltransferase
MVARTARNDSGESSLMGRFLPVCSGAGINRMPAPRPEAILVSVAYCGTPASLNSIKNLIKLSNTKKIFLDNGMFTFFRKWQNGEKVIFDKSLPLYPKGDIMNLTAEHVIQIALELEPDVLIVPDLPVPRIKRTEYPGKLSYGHEEFQFMTVTYHNLIRAREMTRLRAKYNPSFDLYFTFQGYNLNQLDRIMSELSGLHFDGFCLATRALPWNKLLSMMLMLKYYGVRKIHVLAGSNLPTMIVCAFMARHFFDEVSYDSHNWLNFALKGTFRFYGSMGTARVVEKVDIPNHLQTYTCDCLHCQGRSLTDLKEMIYDREKQNLLACHNYYIETRTAEALFEHSETTATLRDFLLANSTRFKLINEILEALYIVQVMKDKIDKAILIKRLANYIFTHFKAK